MEKGEAVNINWKSHLNAMIKIHHSTTDGTALINLGDEAILFKTFLTCSYTPDKPWVRITKNDPFMYVCSFIIAIIFNLQGPQLDRFTRHFEAAGLFQYLKDKALRRLRREERNEDRKVTSPFLDQTCPEGTCPLILEHFVGTGLIYAICLAGSLLGLVAEIMLSRFGTKRALSILLVD